MTVHPDEPQTDSPASNEAASERAPIKIKKYANRRLYNTATSSYVTLDHLCRMVKDGQDFVVHDAKTGEDITRSVLTQIIVEEEAKGGQNMLPVNFLRQLISFYGDNLQALVPRYLENSMAAFARNQEQMRGYMQGAFGMLPFSQQLEEMGKQNMALFQNALRMFSPFKFPAPGEAPAQAEGAPAPAGSPGASSGTPGGEAELTQLRDQLAAMQRRLDDLQKKV
ncbi:MAG: polyhydroxyalkanoate synthesis repressor PhaR [Alphaproteobacteria bacterium]|nr:polyhydroxyalkanoate synthesis repressor PhaR [Alphaproteobacteria bacterium]